MRNILGYFVLFSILPVVANSQEIEEFPPAEQARLIERRTAEVMRAPERVRSAALIEVESFFVDEKGRALERPKTAELMAYAERLHTYYQSRDPNEGKRHGIFYGFIENKLRPFIRSLSLQKLRSTLSARFSVEDLVVSQQLGHVARQGGFARNALRLFTGPHLRAASVRGLKLVALAAIIYAATQTGSVGKTMIITALSTAIISPIISSAFGWFTDPTNQFIRKEIVPLVGPLSRFMNRVVSTVPNEEVMTPRPANRSEDGTTLAGMTEADQRENISRVTRWWTELVTKFGGVFRDIEQGGRGLVTGHTNDQVFFTTLIETIETKMFAFRNLEESLLTPYKIARVGDRHQLEILENAFDNYNKKALELMTTVVMSEDTEARLWRELDDCARELMKLGFTKRDMLELQSLQAKRARSLSELATTVAADTIRIQNLAEYRTLRGPLFDYFKALRDGLQLQDRIETHQKLIAHKQVQMGYANSSLPPARYFTPGQCAIVFEGRPLPSWVN